MFVNIFFVIFIIFIFGFICFIFMLIGVDFVKVMIIYLFECEMDNCGIFFGNCGFLCCILYIEYI